MKRPSPLRSIRQRSGLTLTETAQRSGICKSDISDYELGKREAAPGTLARIVAAIDAAPSIDPGLELQHDLAEDLDVPYAEAETIRLGIDEAIRRRESSDMREVLEHFLVHALRRQRAILRAVRLRVESLTQS